MTWPYYEFEVHETIPCEKSGEILGEEVFKFPAEARAENMAKAEGYSLMKTDTTESAEGIPWESYGFWMKTGYKDTGERLTTKWDFKTIPFVKHLK